MHDHYKIANDTITDIINESKETGEPFDFMTLQERIKGQGGILRVAPGYSVKKFLEELKDYNVIDYLGDNKFITHQ